MASLGRNTGLDSVSVHWADMNCSMYVVCLSFLVTGLALACLGGSLGRHLPIPKFAATSAHGVK